MLAPTLTANCSCLGIQPRSHNNSKYKKLSLGSWNVRTLQDNVSAPERKTALICLELEKYDIDIAALSETRLAGVSQLTEVKGGYDIYWSGKDETESRHSGV